jgi:hypothetical protein
VSSIAQKSEEEFENKGDESKRRKWRRGGEYGWEIGSGLEIGKHGKGYGGRWECERGGRSKIKNHTLKTAGLRHPRAFFGIKAEPQPYGDIMAYG